VCNSRRTGASGVPERGKKKGGDHILGKGTCLYRNQLNQAPKPSIKSKGEEWYLIYNLGKRIKILLFKNGY